MSAEVVGMGAGGAEATGIDRGGERAAIERLEWFEPPANVLSAETGRIDRGVAITLILDPIDAASNATAAAELAARDAGHSQRRPDRLPVAAIGESGPPLARGRNLATRDMFPAGRGCRLTAPERPAQLVAAVQPSDP